MTIQVPDAAGKIIKQLNTHGFEAYAVGGCVRDSLLGRVPKDWDITTSAKPEQVKQIFARTVDTGILHGTVTVLMEHEAYEVTTYRIDGEYEDGRHPKSVEFTKNLLEDLKRRDFTINAMAYSERDGLVDAFGGAMDLNAGIIRCVGNPMDRFHEDALRILRAIRFSAQLGFRIEEETYKAIFAIAPNMEKVSKERIAVELTKLLLSDYPEQMKAVFESGIAPYVSEHFSTAERGLFELEKLKRLPSSKHVRWSGFLRFLDQKEAAGILKELKLDNDTMDQVRILTGLWKTEIPALKPEIRKVMSRIKTSLFEDLLNVQSVFLNGPYLDQLKTVRQFAGEIINDGDCIHLKDMAVTGRDLMEAGIKPGPKMGEILEALFDEVIKNPENNNREYLLNYSKDLPENMPGHG
ncbi:CCA tRNA nucleotidyltransferase [Lacrimispora amygdalina]|uniref:CCA tRNA nucleotidyltransferase n=1 Tax=Lacrimispora amygdalina TaxID=253257 RepID=A0A3E2N6V8_9FIRM|nr:CCA tRNA nucleotidyltransferase [Clostridium indicum]RFZ76730.1 CCA tRNA nucleotidyltransferase [Clostridium indicum]